MGNNKKKQNPTTHQKPSSNKDTFDVKENLKKLRSGSDNYSTDFNAYSNESIAQNLSSETESVSITGSPMYSDKVDLLRDRVASDLSMIRQNLDDHKDKINERFNGDIAQLRSEINTQSEKFDNKISGLVSEKWLAAIIGVVILIAGIIYTLSYSGIISDVKEIKINQIETEIRLDKVSDKIESLNTEKNIVPETESKAIESKKP